MTDELQAEESGITLDSDPIENNEAGTETTNESGAELAPATGENQDKNEGDITEQTKKAINKQHAKYREEERKRIALEDKLAKANEQISKFEAEKGDVTIPLIPDRYDFDSDEAFNAAVQARDDAIMQKATQDAQHQNALDTQTATKEAAQQAEQEQTDSLVKDFDSRIVKLGLEPEVIRTAVNTIVDYGISKDVGEYILGHEDGPLITQYLAENPIELDELRNLPPIMAAMRINSEIKLAASANKPQASNAPDPTEVLSGRGAKEMESPLLKGATFT